MTPNGLSAMRTEAWRPGKSNTTSRFIEFLVRSPKDGELLGLERGMMLQVSNIIFPDENSGVRCQYYKGSDKI